MTNWTTDRIETNGIHMNIYRTGTDAPHLILLHGLTDNGLCWLRLMNSLRDDYDLLMPDARGHGLSDKPEKDYSVITMADDIVGLLDAMQFEQPILIGHSMGAETAAHVAARYPNLVKALILEDPPWRDEALSQAVIDEWRENLRHEQATMSQKDLIAMGHETQPKWDDIEFEHWAEATLQMRLNALDYMAEARIAWRELCQKITCPTLLITADVELGAIVNSETASEAINLLKNGKQAQIEGAGHNIRREQFDAYEDITRHFLAEHT